MHALPAAYLRRCLAFGVLAGFSISSGRNSLADEPTAVAFPEIPSCVSTISDGSLTDAMQCIGQFTEAQQQAFEAVEATYADLREARAAVQVLADRLNAQRGMVAAFQTECPEQLGWSPYYDAGGRFIIGAGPHGVSEHDRNLDSMNRELLPRNIGDEGGELAVLLHPTEIPPHLHRILYGVRWLLESDFAEDGNHVILAEGIPDQPGGERVRDGFTYRTYNPSSQEEIVEARAHNNIPPFVALQFCQYIGMTE